MLTEPPDTEVTKRRNIVDMALGFTAMTRIFSVGSKAKVELGSSAFLKSSRDQHPREYEARHRSFCEWFAREIWTAEKKLKNASSSRASQRRMAKAQRSWISRSRSTFDIARNRLRRLHNV